MGKYGLLGSSSSIGLIITVMCLLAVLGYLFGGINSAILLSKLKYKDDIRKYGSKNAGMTNMLRTYGKGAALLTVLGDVLKTVVPCIIGTVVMGNTGAFIAGCFAVVGHVWPLWFGFRGGKGVMAFLTMMAFCSPDVFLIMFTVFFIIVAFTRYISLGSVMVALLYPLVLSRFIGAVGIIPLVLIVSVIIVAKHWSNIKRLIAGEENKLTLTKSGEGVPKWLAISGSALLIAGIIVMLLLKSMYYNGAWERSRNAVSCGDTRLSQLQLRILFIDEKDAYFKDGEQNEEYDDEAMRLALVRANRMLVLNRCAVEAGYSISDEGADLLLNYAKDTMPTLEDWQKNDTPESYLRRKYGVGVKYEDYIAIIRAEIYGEEYALMLGKEQADALVNNNDDDVYISVNEKNKERVINKY